MTRGKVTLAYITNAKYRRASFNKRKKGLVKKVVELRTLCGVEACAVIYNAHDLDPEVCPSHPEAVEVLARFKKLSEMDQTSKMENDLSFIRQQIKKVDDKIHRVHKKNEQKEMERLMVEYLTESPKHRDLCYTSEMFMVINKILEDINSIIDSTKKKSQHQPGGAMEGASY